MHHWALILEGDFVFRKPWSLDCTHVWSSCYSWLGNIDSTLVEVVDSYLWVFPDPPLTTCAVGILHDVLWFHFANELLVQLLYIEWRTVEETVEILHCSIRYLSQPSFLVELLPSSASADSAVWSHPWWYVMGQQMRCGSESLHLQHDTAGNFVPVD